MRNILQFIICFVLLTASSLAQGKRLWVLRAPGEMVEYDPATFAVKQTVKVPAEAMKSPESIRVNRAGQILFAIPVPLPLAEEDVASAHKVWIWNGHSATTIDQGVTRVVSVTGSNQAVTGIGAPVPFLSADGGHLFWFANQARRLQREAVDLSDHHDLAGVADRFEWRGPRGVGHDEVSRLPMRDRDLRGNVSVWRVLGARERRGEIFSDDAVCPGAD